MESSDIAKVFLSYARKDGSDLARRLHEDLQAHGVDTWLDRHRLSGGASWTEEIERALDGAAFFLAVMTRGSYESEICRAEQLRALRQGKLVIPLLGQPDRDVVPLHLETRNYRDLAADYAHAFKDLLEDIANRRCLITVPSRYRETAYNTVPPLPVNYVERARELRALRDALITDGDGRHIALTALRGMGGIGKSILAQALCHDTVVQQAFPDGIVWLTIGREPAADALTWLREAAKALGDDLAHYENRAAAQNRFRSILLDRAALIVLDDVWDAGCLESFLVDAPRSRLLITTRDASIAAGAGATEHVANLLSEADARVVLARWSGVRADRQPAQAEALVRESGRLPLALAMIGAMLRGKPEKNWERVLTLLREADLAKIRAQFPGYPHHDLFRAMEVGLAALEESTRARYLRLAVTLQDMSIAPAVQCTLWSTDEGEAFDTAEVLIGLSLAERTGQDGAIRLHDLQLDYLRAQCPDRESLELIHGALGLSMHVVRKDPKQFASQMVGRLLAYRDRPAISDFVKEIAAAAPMPWLRPLSPSLDPPGGPLFRTMDGHTHWVRGVAVTLDGKRLISASDDKTLKVWDLQNGRLLRTLTGHNGPVYGVAVTADGKQAVSASLDCTVKLWDLETGQVLRTLEGHSYGVNAVTVTADGRRAISASRDCTVRIWDLTGGRELRTLSGHTHSVDAVAVTVDGTVVSASGDGTLKVWNLETGQLIRNLAGHADPVTAVAVTPDGKWAISASLDRTLKLWSLETGGIPRTLTGHSFYVNGVAAMFDGQRAISASEDKTLKVWDLETGCVLRTLESHAPASAVAITADGRWAISASWDHTLKVWNLETSRELPAIEGHKQRVLGTAITADGRRAVSSSLDKTLIVWDPETGRPLRTLEGHTERVLGVALTPDGKSLVSASADKTLKIWDLGSGSALRTLEGHSQKVMAVAVMPTGKQAISASADKTLKIWDLETGCVLRTLEGHSDRVLCVAVAGDGKRAISASGDKTLKVWDLETGCLLRTLEGHSASVLDAALTADGKRAISASGDKTLRVWDLETGLTVRTLEGHSDSVDGVALTAEGRRAISTSLDKTLKIWNLTNACVSATFEFDSAIHCCGCATPNLVAAGDEGGRVHFLVFED